jgi:hypothetical protein
MARNNRPAPAGWQTTASPTGGLDMRVSLSTSKQRAFMLLVWAAPIVWSLFVFLPISDSFTSTVPRPFGISVAVLLFAFAVWCTCAREIWHLDENLLEHRVGIGTWCRRRTFVNAELQIVCRYTGPNPVSVPYYRLYAICDDARHFLFERNEADLEALQSFIADHTGWRSIAPESLT